METIYTKSLGNANSFYANFTNTHFQKVPIPHLTRTMKQKFIHRVLTNLVNTNFASQDFFSEPKVTKELVYVEHLLYFFCKVK